MGRTSTARGTLALDVQDATGLGAGWNTSRTPTTSLAARHALSNAATPVLTTGCCLVTPRCTPAVTTVVYPYMPPAGAVAPTATRMFKAAAGSGGLAQTMSFTVTVPVSAATLARAYAATWTITLGSGPS
ncbi:MAG: hypothetical protein NVSMB55_08640 [Mycobacteriales bacterium]